MKTLLQQHVIYLDWATCDGSERLGAAKMRPVIGLLNIINFSRKYLFIPHFILLFDTIWLLFIFFCYMRVFDNTIS